MAGEQLIEELRETVRKAGAVLKRLETEKEVLEQKLQEAEKRLKEKEEELKALHLKYETLKVAKSLAGAVPQGEDAKSKINMIIRDIDKCIGLLNR